MALSLKRNTYICDICGAEVAWDAEDIVHEEIWGCESCGKDFCTKCFVDRHGKEAYEKMLTESPVILCPDCFGKEEM